METLVKIIEEKMLLIEQLEAQLTEAKENAKKQTDSMLYWYEKCTALSTLKTKENE
jgi:hypothetical protein